METQKLLAAKLDLDIDYARIKEELLSVRDQWIASPPWKGNIDAALRGDIFMSESEDYYRRADLQEESDSRRVLQSQELPGQHIFYLREHVDNIANNQQFSITKRLSTEGWHWRDDIKAKIPYTIECIEKFPYNHLGCIRVFVTENTFFATHRDYGWGREELSTDYDKCFGLSLIPDDGGVPMKIQSFKDKQVHEIPGNAMLFNDSAWHGVGFVPGIRISIRIFGSIDFNTFVPYIDGSHIVSE